MARPSKLTKSTVAIIESIDKSLEAIKREAYKTNEFTLCMAPAFAALSNHSGKSVADWCKEEGVKVTIISETDHAKTI